MNYITYNSYKKLIKTKVDLMLQYNTITTKEGIETITSFNQIEEEVKEKIELSPLQKDILELEAKENKTKADEAKLVILKKELAKEEEENNLEGDLQELRNQLEELENKEDKDRYDMIIIDDVKTQMARINKVINERNKESQKPILTEEGRYFPTVNKALYDVCNLIKTTGFENFTYVYKMTEKVSCFVEVSKGNGTFKELNKTNFIESVKLAYFQQFKKNLVLNKKAFEINPETGEVEKYIAGNGQEYEKSIDETSILFSYVRKVHDVVFTLQHPPLSTFTNEFNGRSYFNAKCDPIKIRKLKQKVKGKSKIKKITKETAKANGYPHVYAYYHNLMNPTDPKNQGEIRAGNKDDDIMSLLFNRYAYILQTGKKVFTYPVYCSQQGRGKNEHYERFIQWVFGDELAGLSSNDALGEQFNGQMRSKLYVAIDEVKVERKLWDQTSMRLKALTNNKFEVRQMQTDRFNEELLASFEMYSNFDTPYKLEISDRRCITVWGGEFLPDFCARLGYPDASVFLEIMSEEMEFFVMDLLRLELNTQMAKIGIIFSQFRKDLIKRTNTITDVVVDAIVNKKISEIQTIFADINEEDLKELTDHITHNFVTPKDCKIMKNEMLNGYGVEETETREKNFWDKRLNKIETVAFINEEGKTSTKDIRKLEGWKPKDTEKGFNVYVRHTDDFRNPDLDFDDDFAPSNLTDNNQKPHFLDSL